MHVHQHEISKHRVPREQTILWTLRRQTGRFLYPVHRLDVATEGVLIMALSSEDAAGLQKVIQAGGFNKVYYAICRGWPDPAGTIDMPLERDSNGTMAESKTHYRVVARSELPIAVGKKHPTSRYSLLELTPETGRWHQIRRHLARKSHPIIGDREHGDSHHNRFFRENLGLGGLWLISYKTSFRYKEHFYELISAPSDRWLDACCQLDFWHQLK